MPLLHCELYGVRSPPGSTRVYNFELHRYTLCSARPKASCCAVSGMWNLCLLMHYAGRCTRTSCQSDLQSTPVWASLQASKTAAELLAFLESAAGQSGALRGRAAARLYDMLTQDQPPTVV